MKNKTIGILIIMISLCVLVLAGTLGYIVLIEQDAQPTVIQNSAIQTTVPEQAVGLEKTVKGSYLTYINNDYGFKVDYPKNWKQVPLDMKLGNKRVEGVMFTLEESPEERYVFEILNENLPPEAQSLEEYIKLSMEMLSNMLNDYNEENSLNTRIGDMPAKELIFTYQLGETRLKAKAIFAVKNNKGFVLMYIALPHHYSNSLSTADKMIDSFEFI